MARAVRFLAPEDLAGGGPPPGDAWTPSAPGAGDDATLKLPPVLPGTQTKIENFVSGDLAAGTKYLYENGDRYTDVNSGPPLSTNSAPWSYMDQSVHHYADPRTIVGSGGQPLYMVTGPGGEGMAFGCDLTAGGQQPDFITPSPGVGSYSGAFVWQFDVNFVDAAGMPNGGKFSELAYASASPGWYSRAELSIKVGTPRYFIVNFADGGGHEVGQSPFAHPAPDDLNDGASHTMTLAYAPRTTSGATDGYFFAWVGNQMIVAIHSAYAGITPSGGSRHWCESGDQAYIGYLPDCQVDHATYFNYLNGLTAAFRIEYARHRMWAIP